MVLTEPLGYVSPRKKPEANYDRELRNPVGEPRPT